MRYIRHYLLETNTIMVCLSPINNVLCISQHFSLGHFCICDVTMFLLLRVACSVDK